MESESAAKRRKLRKGTRSCWECKRRKLRCLFEQDSPTDRVSCIGCHRRGTKCVSQEFPEEVSAPLDKVRQMRDRVVRVEDQLEQLIKKVGRDDNTVRGGENSKTATVPSSEAPPPAVINTEPSQSMTVKVSLQANHSDPNTISDGWVGIFKLGAASCGLVGLGKDESLSELLLAALPSQKDTAIIAKARGQLSIFFHELSTPETLLEKPSPTMHPTLIARHMLLLATFLQHLHPEVHEELNALSEPPRTIMKRLANTAISLVTTNDELVGSMEGLECIMLEATYQLNWGNMRRAFIATRRAVVIAQLMGLHRSVPCKVLEPSAKAHPQEIWFHILHCDRGLCLFLGLPQASVDDSMASKAMLDREDPLGRLERMHSVIASRIMARNESTSASSSQDFTLTQEIDAELQKAAKYVPSKWWLMPNLSGIATDEPALYMETRRLVDQVFHYNLLNMLHLPQMLRSSTDHKYEYSKMMCVNASREMLARFNMFRSLNRISSSFRVIDFLALIAGMTLLLAHLDSHRSPETANLLAHQSLGDRALIEQVRENMVEVGRMNTDALSAQSAGLLGRLSIIEAQVADGNKAFTAVLQNQLEIQRKLAEEDDIRHGTMPDGYNICLVSKLSARFGLINVNLCNDELPVDAPRPRSFGPKTNGNQSSGERNPNTTKSNNGHTQVTAPLMELARRESTGDLPTVLATAFDSCEEPVVFNNEIAVGAPIAPQLPNDTLLQQYPYHELTAGVEDWAFQGVDTAFLDSLMRGAGDDEYTGAEWLTWQNHS